MLPFFVHRLRPRARVRTPRHRSSARIRVRLECVHRRTDRGGLLTTPEQLARHNIDRMLDLAGWSVQDTKDRDFAASRGVALREFPLEAGFADYMLFVERQAVGIVKAKKEGKTLG